MSAREWTLTEIATFEEKVRSAEQAVVRAARRAAKQAPYCPCPGCWGAKRALARLDKLTKGDR